MHISYPTIVTFIICIVLTSCTGNLAKLPESAQKGQYSNSYTYQLDNGLTVLLWPNKNSYSKNEVSLDLVIHAGSLQETDEQLGYAHFVEHMVFNQIDGANNNPVRDILKELNLDLGIHSNAQTYFDYTLYYLDLPDANNQRVDRGLDLLSLAAFNTHFNEAEVDKEIGVVREEWRRSQPEKDNYHVQRRDKNIANSRYESRLPIGTLESIDNVSVNGLQQYYTAHYRPNNATLIVTGDFDTSTVVEAIEQKFAAWQQKHTGRAETYSLPDIVQGTYDVYTDINIREYYLWLGNTYHSQHIDRPESVYWHTVTDLVLGMLDDRMQKITKQQHEEIRDLAAYSEHIIGNHTDIGVGLVSSEAKLQEGFTLLGGIIKDLTTHGFTQVELDNTRRTFLAAEKNQQDSASHLSSVAFHHVTYGSWLRDQHHYYELMVNNLANLALSELNAHVKTLFAQPYKISITSHPNKAVPDEELVRGWIKEANALKQAPTTTQSAAAKVAWQINLPPGKVTHQEKLPNGIHQLTLNNGIHANYKYSDTVKDRVFMSLLAPVGFNGLNDQDIINAYLGNVIMGASGLQSLDGDALKEWLEGQNLTLAPEFFEGGRGFYLEGDRANLDNLLQTLHVALQDARVDMTTYNYFIPQFEQYIRDTNSLSYAKFQQEVEAIISQGDIAYRDLTLDEINSASPEGMQAVYKKYIAGAQNYTLNIVGDISLNHLTPYLTSYVASLPTNPATLNTKPSSKMIGDFEVIEQGNTSKAANVHYFLQVNSDPSDASIAMQWQLLAILLGKELQNTIREELGLTYAINVFPYQNFYNDESMTLAIILETDPDNVTEVRASIETLMADLHMRGFEQKDIDAELATLRRDFNSNIHKAQFILDQMVHATLQGKAVENSLAAQQIFPDMTATQLNQLMDQLWNKRHGKLVGILYP